MVKSVEQIEDLGKFLCEQSKNITSKINEGYSFSIDIEADDTPTGILFVLEASCQGNKLGKDKYRVYDIVDFYNTPDMEEDVDAIDIVCEGALADSK